MPRIDLNFVIMQEVQGPKVMYKGPPRWWFWSQNPLLHYNEKYLRCDEFSNISFYGHSWCKKNYHVSILKRFQSKFQEIYHVPGAFYCNVTKDLWSNPSSWGTLLTSLRDLGFIACYFYGFLWIHRGENFLILEMILIWNVLCRVFVLVRL